MANELNQELIRRMLDAQANPVADFDPTKITQAVSGGLDLANTIQTRKQAQEDRVKKLADEIAKATKQKTLTEATKPIPKTKTIRELVGNQPTPVAPHEPVESLDGTLSIPESSIPGLEYDKSRFVPTNIRPKMQYREVPLTSEEQTAAEQARKDAIFQASVDLAPEDYAKSQFKESISSDRFQQGTAEINGRVESVVFDKSKGTYATADGKPIEGRVIRGFKPDIRVDPATEQLLRITTGGSVSGIGGQPGPRRNEQGQPIEISSPQDLTVRQSGRVNELRKNFEADDIVKASRGSLAVLDNLKTVQDLQLPALIGSLQSLRARGLATEKGVLTQQDIERTTGSPQLWTRIENAALKLLKGKESPQNIAEFRAALKAVEDATRGRLQAVENDYITQAKSSKELQFVSPNLLRSSIGFQSQSTGIPGQKPPLDSFRR